MNAEICRMVDLTFKWFLGNDKKKLFIFQFIVLSTKKMKLRFKNIGQGGHMRALKSLKPSTQFKSFEFLHSSQHLPSPKSLHLNRF